MGSRTRAPCKIRHRAMRERPEGGLEIVKNRLGRQHETLQIDRFTLPPRIHMDENGNHRTVRRREVDLERSELLRRGKMKPGSRAGKIAREFDAPMFGREAVDRAVGADRVSRPGIADRWRQRHSEAIEIVVGRQERFETAAALELPIRHVEDTFHPRQARSPPHGMGVRPFPVKTALDRKGRERPVLPVSTGF